MIVDSSLFLYADITQSFNYLRYGYDGIFPNTAEYCWDNPNPNVGKNKKRFKHRTEILETWWRAIYFNLLPNVMVVGVCKV